MLGKAHVPAPRCEKLPRVVFASHCHLNRCVHKCMWRVYVRSQGVFVYRTSLWGTQPRLQSAAPGPSDDQALAAAADDAAADDAAVDDQAAVADDAAAVVDDASAAVDDASAAADDAAAAVDDQAASAADDQAATLTAADDQGATPSRRR